MNLKNMQEVVRGAQEARNGNLERENQRLQSTVDYYNETINALDDKLKEAQDAAFTAEAAVRVLSNTAANARGAEETLNYVLKLLATHFANFGEDWQDDEPDMFELRLIAFADDEEIIRDILDETPVLNDTDTLRALRLRHCSVEDEVLMIQAGVIRE